MTMNGRSVSCVVQYVIFPPHSSAGSSNMSTWSEEDNFDTGKHRIKKTKQDFSPETRPWPIGLKSLLKMTFLCLIAFECMFDQ